MPLPPTDDPFLEGVKARHLGIPRTDCPYANETDERVAWEDGWGEGGALDEEGEVKDDEA
jgi:hypothetical protein